MKQISASSAVKVVMEILMREDEVEVELLSFKKDRSILISREGEKFTLVHRGYSNSVVTVGRSEVHKSLKKSVSLEFPRSNTLYLIVRKRGTD